MIVSLWNNYLAKVIYKYILSQTSTMIETKTHPLLRRYGCSDGLISAFSAQKHAKGVTD
jgi:hypothetical protein